MAKLTQDEILAYLDEATILELKSGGYWRVKDI